MYPLILFVVVFGYVDSSGIICETGFCGRYQSEPGCAAAAQECRVNNATHFGLSLPSPTTCNCCEFCLPLYVSGHRCSVGGAGDGLTIGRCGPSLTCAAGDDGHGTCQRISGAVSKCHADQDEFDDRYNQGLTGTLEQRPLCDGKGNYMHYYCVPAQTCFCQSNTGERLFGEVLYQSSSTFMNCGCTQVHEKIKANIDTVARFTSVKPRCTSDGSFNPVQCIDRICYCVDTITGAVKNDRSINLDEKPISELHCYDVAQDLYPDLSSSPPYRFTTPCLEGQRARIQLILESEEAGYNVDHFSAIPQCQPDGSYEPVGYGLNGTKICIDERGDRIGDYEAVPGTPDYKTMDCKCARTSQLMASSPEKPICSGNGNFRRLQCRRGECRCVDTNGRQIGIVSEDQDLNCQQDTDV